MACEEPSLLPEALRLGLPEVDAQHEAVFVQVEALKDCCFSAPDCLLAGLEALVADLEVHFATEEHLAWSARLEFSAHARFHERSLRGLRRALSDVRAGTVDAYSLLRFIEFWFERHIAEFDRPFVERLHGGHGAAGRPSPPSVHGGQAGFA